MTTIQIIGVQHPARRQHEHVRVFGYREADPDKQVVEVAATVEEAVEYIKHAEASKTFPSVAVDDRAWIFCLNSGALQIVYVQDKEGSA